MHRQVGDLRPGWAGRGSAGTASLRHWFLPDDLAGTAEVVAFLATLSPRTYLKHHASVPAMLSGAGASAPGSPAVWRRDGACVSARTRRRADAAGRRRRLLKTVHLRRWFASGTRPQAGWSLRRTSPVRLDPADWVPPAYGKPTLHLDRLSSLEDNGQSGRDSVA